MRDYKDMQVVVMGAARQGLALSRYLARHGAAVTLTDSRSADELASQTASLEGSGIRLAFGGHPASILDGADLLCLSGGVDPASPFVREAQSRGIALSNDSQLFLEACPCQSIGITGSAGKTTTTALVGKMAEAFFAMKGNRRRAWVGGNIGNSRIEDVDEMHPDDLAILELSSFQLELMSISPNIAAVLNITPNHLDRHGSMSAYTAAKTRIILHQKQGDVAVLNREDPGSWALTEQLRTDLISFGFQKPGPRENGTYIEKDQIWLQIYRDQLKMFPVDWVLLRGKHNLANVLAACAIAAGASLALPAIQSAVEAFSGVPHRLEFVRSLNGVDYYNDSIATAPERVLAAIEAFDQPLVLLLGGRDKDLPWTKLAEVVRRRASRVLLFGEAAELIAEAIGPRQRGQSLASVVKCKTLQEAVKTAAAQAVPGDVVLLSPGGTSFDAFKDFAERGEMYRQWVNAL